MKTINYHFILVLILLLGTGCDSNSKVKQAILLKSYTNPTANSSQEDTTVTNITANRDSQGRKASLISAFYGLDDALPKPANRGIGEGAGGADGMPVIFSHEIDPNTLEPGDFKVMTASGKIGKISWVTLAPADDKGELRTVLFAGHYGSIEDQPVKVEVVGNILSLDGTINFKGVSIDVTPLEDGPTMVWSEIVPQNEWHIGEKATELNWGGGSGVAEGTKQVVRVTWAGGVTKPGGIEVDDNERQLYKVTVQQKDGRKIEVTPFAIADLGDGDNNHELCLNVTGDPIAVSFPAGHLTDPREDLNPETTINITNL
ncbi:hypothetical protein [Cyclobacterium xiamenense]|uniref:hypothetical protein n=1 Tax=Cyclobacterium xiamenense TaxID=1297121 RepID=UPI0035D0A1FC